MARPILDEETSYESKYYPIGAGLRPWERVSVLPEIYVSQVLKISSRLRNYNIVLGGGNLVFCGDNVIVTDKILKENNQSKDEVETIFREMFNLEPIIIHWEPDREDVYGHTDGMFRALPTKKGEKPVCSICIAGIAHPKDYVTISSRPRVIRLNLKKLSSKRKAKELTRWLGHISIFFKWGENTCSKLWTRGRGAGDGAIPFLFLN